MRYGIGIDIGGTKCSVVSADPSCVTLDPKKDFLTKRVFETDVFDYNKMIGQFCECVDEILESHAGTDDELIGIGISCGGPLDSKRGIIQCPPNLPGWDDVHICDTLREKYGCKVVLENDANACGVAEWRFGAAKGCKNVIFLTFGTGLGAGSSWMGNYTAEQTIWQERSDM